MAAQIPSWLLWFAAFGILTANVLLVIVLYGYRPKKWWRKSVYTKRGMIFI